MEVEKEKFSECSQADEFFLKRTLKEVKDLFLKKTLCAPTYTLRSLHIP